MRLALTPQGVKKTLGARASRPPVVPGRLRKNPASLSFRGARGDEESRISFTFRARFLASLSRKTPFAVIPAKAGIESWTPAYAGVTEWRLSSPSAARGPIEHSE